MALPKLLQKLFTNGGAGDKLNQDIIPDIPYSKVTDAPVVDSALSPTSTNAVQNKVINSALDGKLSLSGGNVNGDITFRTWGAGIGGSVATGGWYGFNAGTSWELLNNDGACLWLCGNGVGGHNTIGINGEFVLSTGRGTIDYYTLRGKPDGSLTWGGKTVWCGGAMWPNHTNLTIGQSFTAPSRGFVYSRGNSTSAWGALHTSVNGIHLLGQTGKETDTGGTVYVNAGDTVIVSKDGTVEHISVIFVPIQ